MHVEWKKATAGACSRCAGLRRHRRAAWVRVFHSPAGHTLTVSYCEDHAATARSLVAA